MEPRLFDLDLQLLSDDHCDFCAVFGGILFSF